MRRSLFALSWLMLSAAPPLLASGNGTFQAPLTIPVGSPGPVTINYGDFDGDGKLDLVVANGVASNQASGSPSVLVLFQNPANRLDWKPVKLNVGVSSVFVRGADMDGDHLDDLLVGDVGKTAWFIRSRGNRAFAPPVSIAAAAGARWIAVADFNNDGMLDFASSNFANQTLTVFFGNGAGGFALKTTIPGAREHTLEAMDYDGDGNMDLMQGSGLPGITPFHGNGDGTFDPMPNVGNMGCIEYISEVGHYDQDVNYVITGDFNGDLLPDLATTCIDDTYTYAGYDLGDGSYTQSLKELLGTGTDATAIGDLDGDGNADVAAVSAGSTSLYVFLSDGGGGFAPVRIFGSTGTAPVFLIAQDLDRDGFMDVISANNGSGSVTIFWGKSGDQFLESAYGISGFTSAKAMAVADLDRDGFPDLLLPRSDRALVSVYSKPGQNVATQPSFNLTVAGKYSLLEAVDLDGDGTLDLVGADTVAGNALVTLLDAAGKMRDQQVTPVGTSPSAIVVGRIDGDGLPDVAIPCRGSNYLAILFGQKGGLLASPVNLPTVAKPRGAALAMVDGDDAPDLVVVGDNAVALHYGLGKGAFGEAAPVVEDMAKLFLDVAAQDLNGDGMIDLAVLESKSLSVLLFPGRGNRLFDPPVAVKVGASPLSLELGDLNGDSRPDLIASGSTSRSLYVLMNLGGFFFAPPATYGLGLSAVVGHRVADLNRDGALDLIGFSNTAATVILGRSDTSPVSLFRRGDATADGRIALDDPIAIIFALFEDGATLPCPDAGDADDDGQLALADPIAILNWIFEGGPDLPYPGTKFCGGDPTSDELGCPAACK